MSMYNDDNVDNFDDEGAPPEESNNRTFLLADGVLGVLVLLAFLCLGGYLIFFRNNTSQQAQATGLAQATQQQATIQVGLTQSFLAQAETLTAAATVTVPPTNTTVVAQATATVSPTADPATATVAAAFTQLAVSTQTVIPTSTALPNTGFADDVGIPGMLAMGLALVAVIFLVRRLRTVPVK